MNIIELFFFSVAQIRGIKTGPPPVSPRETGKEIAGLVLKEYEKR